MSTFYPSQDGAFVSSSRAYTIQHSLWHRRYTLTISGWGLSPSTGYTRAFIQFRICKAETQHPSLYRPCLPCQHRRTKSYDFRVPQPPSALNCALAAKGCHDQLPNPSEATSAAHAPSIQTPPPHDRFALQAALTGVSDERSTTSIAGREGPAALAG